ncbi:MAG: hypothetical protein HY801_06355 [Candidatus Lindowbacteria bacterium]|nr:hypothetical protein [Candidatus Lindowbacteria bacterium]
MSVLLLLNQIKEILRERQTVATKEMSKLFTKPSETLPEEFKEILAKRYENLSEGDLRVLERAMGSKEEFAFFREYPREQLAEMWDMLRLHCMKEAVPAEFEFEMTKDIAAKSIACALEKGTPARLKVTFFYPLDETLSHLVGSELQTA